MGKRKEGREGRSLTRGTLISNIIYLFIYLFIHIVGLVVFFFSSLSLGMCVYFCNYLHIRHVERERGR